MAIVIESEAVSTVAAPAVIATVTDLRLWAEVAGVRVRARDAAADRPLRTGDVIDIAVDVVGRTIGITCVAEVVDVAGGVLRMRTTGGAVDGRIEGAVVAVPTGCEVRLSMHGRGRGVARAVEPALELIGRRWVKHQIDHLLRLSAQQAG